MKVENLGGIKVNVVEALQALLGEAKIEQEDGYFVLNFNDEGEQLQVTVDYERTFADPEKGFVPAGVNSVFNESYSFDTFSFEQFIEDLHDQQLEDVENWIVGFLEEKFRYLNGGIEMIENYKKELRNFIKSNCSEGYWYDFMDLNAFPTAKELWEAVNNDSVDEQEALDAFQEVIDELMISKYENDQYVYQFSSLE